MRAFELRYGFFQTITEAAVMPWVLISTFKVLLNIFGKPLKQLLKRGDASRVEESK